MPLGPHGQTHEDTPPDLNLVKPCSAWKWAPGSTSVYAVFCCTALNKKSQLNVGRQTLSFGRFNSNVQYLYRYILDPCTYPPLPYYGDEHCPECKI